MTKRIFHSTLAVSAAVLLANIIIVMGCLYQYYRDIEESQLADELYLAAQGVDKGWRMYYCTNHLIQQHKERSGVCTY